MRKTAPRVHHLLAPSTGRSARHFASVTLVSTDDNTTLDALATAVAITSAEKALSLLNKFPQIGFLLVGQDQKIWLSQDFFDRVEDPVWSDDKADFKITSVTRPRKI